MARDTSYTLYVTGRTDPTYKNIWAFADRAERTAFLALKRHETFSNNKYWRVGSPIKIPVPYEKSFAYDYVMITNRPGTADEQTYYCFINSRAYLSANSTILNLDIDYVQTFYFSHALDGGLYPFWQVPGFLETGTHAHLLPPRGTASEFPSGPAICSNFQSTSFSGELFGLVIYSTYDLAALYTSDTKQQQTSVISNMPLTAVPYIIMGGTSTDLATIFNTLMGKVNAQGITDSITGVYAIPQNFINLAATPLNTVTAQWVTRDIDITIPVPTACDGYTPVNKSLLGFDYSYFMVNNNMGELQSYHFEDFTGAPHFICHLSLLAGYPVLSAMPTNYKVGASDNARSFIQKISCPVFCSYLNDSYKIWLAQTQNSRQAALDGAQLQINQAVEAREKSLSAIVNSGYNAVQESTIGQTVRNVTQAASSGAATILSDPRGAWERMGASIRSESDATRFSIGAIGRAWKAAGTAPGASEAPTASGAGGIVGFLGSLGEAFVRAQLGIEQAFVYDQNVASAQQNLNQLLAGYKDRAALPATATGSNSYGDMLTHQQYAFMFISVTPTAEFAQWVDKMLSAGGHTVNRYIPGALVKQHSTFDFFRLLSPQIEREQEYRPVFVHNMLISLLTSGVYLWYLDGTGDISPFIGTPYNLQNNEVT